MVSVWVWHVLAGVIGVVISLSAFYQAFEKRLAVHRKLSSEDVARVVGEAGRELTGPARAEFLDFFNRLVYIGRSGPTQGRHEPDTVVELTSGEQIELLKGDRFYEVRRVRRNGKITYYRLYNQA